MSALMSLRVDAHRVVSPTESLLGVAGVEGDPSPRATQEETACTGR